MTNNAKKLLLSGALASLVLGAGLASEPVQAQANPPQAKYHIVTPVSASGRGFVGKKPGKPELPIEIELASGELPEARVGEEFSYDFKYHLIISGDPDLNFANVSFSAPAALPSGLSLTDKGIIEGSPTQKNRTGTAFDVVATYKNKNGQQSYTLIINGAPLENVKEVALGSNFGCALLTTGQAMCWGDGTKGQLGHGLFESSLDPVAVANISDFTQISAGAQHACGVRANGEAWCWGFGDMGRLGQGGWTNSATPLRPSPLAADVRYISAGNAHTCATLNSGEGYCWGANSDAQLGITATTTKTRPTKVEVFSDFAQIASGSTGSCATHTDGALSCWGSTGVRGHLGIGVVTTNQKILPTKITDGSITYKKIVKAIDHSCALSTGNELYCWGARFFTGLGNASDTFVPTKLNLAAVTDFSASRNGACAITASSELYCWGTASKGELALGPDVKTTQYAPVKVPGMTSIASLVGDAPSFPTSNGGGHCAVLSDGTAQCWGDGIAGRFGNAMTTVQFEPVHIEAP